MTLLFTSFFSAGSGNAPAPAEPPFVWTTNLRYRFCAGEGAFSDADAQVPAADMDPVARWANLGSAEDALQSASANRPVWRTNGLNGHPYIACDRSLAQHFEDLAFSQPSGVSNIDTFTVFAVTDAVGELDQFPAILGSPNANGGKVSFYFRNAADVQINWIKSQIRVGNLANPQMIMGAAGRSAQGSTNHPYANFWLRQNRVDIWNTDRQISNLSGAAIATTEFLRSSGISSGCYFHGHLYEFLLYEGTLDNATTFAIEDWLVARYGLA